MAHALGAKTGIPFGPFMFGPDAGQKFFKTLPWAMPLLWVVAVLNSRGVARLILRPWRKIRAYGFWLIGLTAVLTMLFDCALEPFAATTETLLDLDDRQIFADPAGRAAVEFLRLVVVTLLILAFATPAMINKQLSKRSAPDFHPLAVWLGAILLFAAGAAMHGLWLAVAADAIVICNGRRRVCHPWRALVKPGFARTSRLKGNPFPFDVGGRKWNEFFKKEREPGRDQIQRRPFYPAMLNHRHLKKTGLEQLFSAKPVVGFLRDGRKSDAAEKMPVRDVPRRRVFDVGNDHPKFTACFQDAMNFLDGFFDIVNVLQKMEHGDRIHGFVGKGPGKA